MSKKYMVTFRDNVQGLTEKQCNHLHEDCKSHLLDCGATIAHDLDQFPRHFIIDDVCELTLKKLKEDQRILAIEEKPVFGLTNTTELVQKSTTLVGQQVPWSHINMGIEEFHKRGYTGKGVKVGFIDTGCAPHEDLVYAGRYNAYPSTSIDRDMNGHGTSVAGIIGAKNNGKGYVGVAPDCLLYGVKAAPDSQSAGIEPIEVGFNWLVTQGVKIINMSFGGYSYGGTTFYDTLFDELYNRKGVLLVASAGNTGTLNLENDANYLPGGHPFCIGVTCLKNNNEPAEYSTRSLNNDISASGHEVMTTARSIANLNGTDLTTPSTDYRSFSGTSCSAPHIAGLAALYWELYPLKTNKEIRALIEQNVIKLGTGVHNRVFGNGLARSPWTVDSDYKGKTSINSHELGTSLSLNIVKGRVQHVSFKPPQDGEYEITISNAFWTYLRVYDQNYKLVASTADYGLGSDRSNILIREGLFANNRYTIAVSGTDASNEGTVVLTATRIGAIPSTGKSYARAIPITSQLTDRLNSFQPRWYKFTTPSAGAYAFKAFQKDGANLVLDLFNSNYSSIGFDDNSGEGLNPIILAELPAGQTFYIRVRGVSDMTSGDFDITVERIGDTVPKGASFADAITVYDTYDSVLEAGKSKYFKFVCKYQGNNLIRTTSKIDLKMEVYNSSLVSIGSDDDSGGDKQPQLLISLTKGQTYYVRIYGYNSTVAGDFRLHI